MSGDKIPELHVGGLVQWQEMITEGYTQVFGVVTKAKERMAEVAPFGMPTSIRTNLYYNSGRISPVDLDTVLRLQPRLVEAFQARIERDDMYSPMWARMLHCFGQEISLLKEGADPLKDIALSTMQGPGTGVGVLVGLYTPPNEDGTFTIPGEAYNFPGEGRAGIKFTPGLPEDLVARLVMADFPDGVQLGHQGVRSYMMEGAQTFPLSGYCVLEVPEDAVGMIEPMLEIDYTSRFSETE